MEPTRSGQRYLLAICSHYPISFNAVTNDSNLNHHSPERRLIDLKIEHADIDALVDGAVHAVPIDEIMLRRLKKRRLQLRDQISQLEVSLDPREPA